MGKFPEDVTQRGHAMNERVREKVIHEHHENITNERKGGWLLKSILQHTGFCFVFRLSFFGGGGLGLLAPFYVKELIYLFVLVCLFGVFVASRPPLPSVPHSRSQFVM